MIPIGGAMPQSTAHIVQDEAKPLSNPTIGLLAARGALPITLTLQGGGSR
jgi:hypothetical protein